MPPPGLFYHEPVPVAVRISQALGITVTAFLSGSIAAASIQSVPSFMEAPASLLVKQWKKQYDKGKVIGPALSAVGSFIFGSLALREPPESRQFTLYILAAVIVPSIVPYTRLVLYPVNQKLIAKADSLASTEAKEAADKIGIETGEESAHALLDRWATLNLFRAMIAGLGAFVGAWAVVDRLDVVPLEGLGVAAGADRLR